MSDETNVTNIADMIKVTNRQAIELLSNAIWVNRQIPVKTRYWLSRIADKLKSIANAAAKERQKIIDDMCVKDENGVPKRDGNRPVFESPAKEQECNEEIKKLYDVENTLPWPKQAIDLAKLPDNFELSAADMADAEFIAEFTFSESPKAEAKA